ncbi:MAG: glycosyltransferase, partial [Propionibacteriaceae bacterium]
TPVSDDVIVIEPVPHEWLFPRMRAVVHHGGAGTTAAAFRAGIPQGIIPHIADRPYWGRRVHALGVGPEAVARHRLTVQGLTGMVTQLTSIPTMALRAADLGSRLLAEDGVSTAVETILRLLD